MTMIDPYMPTPSISAATFVHHTDGTRITVRSMSGTAERLSTSSHPPNSVTAAANRPIVPADAQPQVEPLDSPSSSATSHAASAPAAATLTEPVARTGDSGMNATVAATASPATISGNQNSQCHD